MGSTRRGKDEARRSLKPAGAEKVVERVFREQMMSHGSIGQGRSFRCSSERWHADQTSFALLHCSWRGEMILLATGLVPTKTVSRACGLIWERRQRGRVEIRSGQDGILPSLISFSSREISCRLFAFRIISSTCFRSSSVSLMRCCVLLTGPADEEERGWPFAADDEPSEGMSKVRD